MTASAIRRTVLGGYDQYGQEDRGRQPLHVGLARELELEGAGR